MRYAMRAAGLTQFSEDLLEHGYKEMTFPPGPGGEYCMNKVAHEDVGMCVHMHVGVLHARI